MTEERAEYRVPNQAGIASLAEFKNRPCALPFSDPSYRPPTPEEVDALIRLSGWSQNQTAKITGAAYNPKKGSTTVRKWRTAVDSPEHRDIPYAAWRLLLINAGVATEKDTQRQLHQVAEGKKKR